MRFALVLITLMMCSSCMIIDGGVEVGKTIWGSSTRALENAKRKAITKTYDKEYWTCVRAALEVVKKNNWTIFKKDEVQGYLVLMGIPGAVDTTEVGVFFEELSDEKIHIEITSLSTNAKRKVAKALFHGLDIAFGLVPPDPEEPVVIDDEEAAKKKT